MLNSASVKILVVHEDKFTRTLLATRFGIFGFPTTQAKNGREAEEILQSDDSIKIVVSSLEMTDGSGRDLLISLRHLNPDGPKFFAITNETISRSEDCLALGAEGVLLPPYEARSLLAIIRHSILPMKDRLQFPPHVSPQFKMSTTNTTAMSLGRGGLFVSTSLAVKEIETIVELDIVFNQIHLTGSGLLRWIRSAPGSKNFYVGMEFVHLSPSSREQLQRLMATQSPVSYIPSPDIAGAIVSDVKLKPTG